MPDLEYISHPKKSTVSDTVISSFVKLKRMDQAEGKFREDDLIEELIKSEVSKG
jgi:hypothetical protein